MELSIRMIPRREVLHFLGWRGAPVEDALLSQIEEMTNLALEQIEPRVEMRRFALNEDKSLAGTRFSPQGADVRALLVPCHEAVLLAATLGAQSERLLLRMQAKDSALALIMDAVLSAAIEAVCDAQEAALRDSLAAQELYLTDRFSPGYGDMPLAQTREICAVLSADKMIGLTVSQSGIMIPRKSVTAIMGVSRAPVSRRPSGCAACSMRGQCTLCKDQHIPPEAAAREDAAERTDP